MASWYPARVRRPLTLIALPVHRDIGPASPRGFRRLTLVIIRSETTVAVKIRLLRMGKIRNPQYRIVVADSRTKRDGRAIEYVGIYQPKHDPSVIEVKSERVQYWLSRSEERR